MNISLNQIEGLAPNAEALKKGKELVQKNKYANLKIDAGQTVIWGECAGSGKNPYYCSVDFVEANNPIARCNCPSRQFPCKHGIGLLLAFEKGLAFDTADIPEDILFKRDKITAKVEKKEKEKESLMDKAAAPKKVNKSVVTKKTSSQLEGISVSQKLLTNIVVNGIASIDAKLIKDLEMQVKDLGNYYIPGIQTAFTDLLLQIRGFDNENSSTIIDKVNYLNALLKKATVYLQERLSNPEMPIDTTSEIEEQIGTIWKSVDLVGLGLYEQDVNLIQLSFYNYDDVVRKEYLEVGVWWNINTSKILLTKNYRPYKALKYVKEENSNSKKLHLKTLIINPSEINPRVRWEKSDATELDIDVADYQSVLNAANTDYAATVKQIKNIIKNPLSNKNPFSLLKLNKSYLLRQQLIIEDENGYPLTLSDDPDFEIVTTQLLQSILPSEPDETLALLVYFNNNLTTGILEAIPLSLISKSNIIKLKY